MSANLDEFVDEVFQRYFKLRAEVENWGSLTGNQAAALKTAIEKFSVAAARGHLQVVFKNTLRFL